MNVHGPSVAIGFSAALVTAFAARRLRPVAVEIGALVVEIVKMSHSAIELQRECLEDFRYDVLHRQSENTRKRRDERRKHSPAANPAPVGAP